MRWSYRSKYGVVSIVRMRDGLFHIVFDDESLGGYSNPALALDDAVMGCTYTPSNGIDLDRFGLPDDLSEWHYQPPRRL
ncbi:hypothetical protein ACLIOB_001185 [Vibrio cholerae]|uniref:hypothetical protein n=1 Tax=Vibrio cholerae TaxID=666 RepID=UPI002270FEF6|nr:hypothetical protein [Vibrio cholerae]MCX9472426.1 hypothetical protein [Vibrio cholerae]MCX9484173.1 hypothetical protein [Vibrio cholerae]MCX9491233.1 hypothetical protein [Vibrio cholerae]